MNPMSALNWVLAHGAQGAMALGFGALLGGGVGMYLLGFDERCAGPQFAETLCLSKRYEFWFGLSTPYRDLALAVGWLQVLGLALAGALVGYYVGQAKNRLVAAKREPPG